MFNLSKIGDLLPTINKVILKNILNSKYLDVLKLCFA